LVGQLRDEAADSGGMQRDGDAVGRDVDPLDQQPEDSLLAGIGSLPTLNRRPDVTRANLCSC
jgi:hypothetical protein